MTPATADYGVRLRQENRRTTWILVAAILFLAAVAALAVLVLS